MSRGRGRGRSINKILPPVGPIRVEQRATLGKSIDLRTNFFQVEFSQRDAHFYRYDLDIRNRKNSTIPRLCRRRVFQLWLNENFDENFRKNIAFDNEKIVVTFEHPLPDVDSNGFFQTIHSVDSNGKQIEYHLTIKQIGDSIEFDLKNVVVQQILSIGFHEFCSSRSDFIYKRTFFRNPTAADRCSTWDLGSGSAAWRGFYSCLNFPNGQFQMLNNLDIRYGVFAKDQPFINFILELMAENPTGKTFSNPNINDFPSLMKNRRNAEFFLEHCRNVRVRSEIGQNPIRYVINDFGAPASEQTFLWSKNNNESITVEKYYLEQYRIRLQFPSLPTLKMTKDAFVPMEFLHVESIRITKFSEEQMAKLCRCATLRPKDYEEKILENLKENFEENPLIRAWKFQVKNTMINVQGRILPRPKVVVDNDGFKFYKAAEFPKVWAMINLTSTWKINDCKDFYLEFQRIAQTKGIQCCAPEIYEEFSPKNACEAVMKLVERNPDCEFLFVLLPEEKPIRDEIYGKLKTLCEGEDGLGLVSQMSIVSKLRGRNSIFHRSTIENLLQKINPKLNGINSIVDISNHSEFFLNKAKNVMYIGIDLSHWIGSDGIKRSTVAVVASADHLANRFFKEISYQEKQTNKSIELIVNIKEIFKNLIKNYFNSSQSPPSTIIVYRDGYSISEFQTIFEDELQALRTACVELSTVYRPHLTYIIVNKRHATRFFGEDQISGISVDSIDISSTIHYSFYLTSHEVFRGTSRPTFYHVLHDDNHLTSNELQMLTFALCFTCARSTKSISIPSPVKYADLLAYRARFYLQMNSIRGNSRLCLSSKLDADRLFFL